MAPNDIDAIWASMKREDEIRLRCKQSKKKGTMEKKKKQQKTLEALIDRKSATPQLPPPSVDDTPTPKPTPSSVATLKASILTWSREHDPNLIHALGDSDDEDSDNGGDDLPPPLLALPPSRSWSIARFSSAITSSDVSARVDGLTALHLAITELLLTDEDKVPPLDLPPPYDHNRIALTHREQGTLVSDMAATQWSQWDRTHASLMSQFRPSGEPASDSSSASAPDRYNDSTQLQLQALLNGCGCSIFRRFGDKIEKCRALAIRCVGDISLAGIDFGEHIGLLMPAVLARFPPVSFDAEMGVFVHDANEHDCHRRGGAVARQDKDDSRTIPVVETSEELRLRTCDLISFVVRGALARDALSILDPYFADLVLALYTMLRDPCPDVKVRSSRLLTQLVRIPQWEAGAKFFALALTRAAIPNLRHRNSKVRLTAIELFEASVCVPNREKLRGAGSDGIADLIGFREDNVIPIAAYYSAQCSVAVNTLAELAIDKNAKVRERCCEMLAYFMVCLPDRYDHQTRLLPYVLHLYLDPVASIRKRAMDTVDVLGARYEAEHPGECGNMRRQTGESSFNLYSTHMFLFLASSPPPPPQRISSKDASTASTAIQGAIIRICLIPSIAAQGSERDSLLGPIRDGFSLPFLWSCQVGDQRHENNQLSS